MNNFADYIRRWRDNLGMTREQAAEALGVGLRTLESWEQGLKTPRELTVEALRARMKSVKLQKVP